MCCLQKVLLLNIYKFVIRFHSTRGNFHGSRLFCKVPDDQSSSRRRTAAYRVHRQRQRTPSQPVQQPVYNPSYNEYSAYPKPISTFIPRPGPAAGSTFIRGFQILLCSTLIFSQQIRSSLKFVFLLSFENLFAQLLVYLKK